MKALPDGRAFICYTLSITMEKIKITLQRSLENASLPEKIAAFIIGLVVFLIPLFFIPSVFVPFQYAKAVLLILGTLLALFFWFIARIKDGTFIIPWSPTFVALLSIPFLALISALFSGHVGIALMGDSYELGTVSMLAVLTLLTFLISLLFRSKEKILYSYVAFIIAFILVMLFQIVRLFAGPNILQLSNFFDTGANLIGKWNDLGVFAGLGILLAFISLELLELTSVIKVVLYAVIVLGFFFMALTNFYVNFYFFSVSAAVVMGVVALVVFVYLISYSQSRRTKENVRVKIPAASFIVLILSIVFVLAGGFINGRLSQYFNIAQIDARPSWQATFGIAQQTLRHGVEPFLLGSGPNRFTSQWLLYKPAIANQSAFWNVDFTYGIGFIPTALITGGILGLLSWVAFLIFYVREGLKALFSGVKDRFALFLLLSSFVSSLYLWAMCILYVPSIVTITLTFAFTGFFLAAALEQKSIETKVFEPFKTQQLSFVAMLCISLLMIGVIVWGNIFVSKVVASAYAAESSVKYSAGDVASADTWLTKAISLDGSDTLYRGLTQVALTGMQVAVSNASGASANAAARSAVQNALSQALGAAGQAVTLDPSNYQNWDALGTVYQAATALKVDQAYDNAKYAYNQALALDPEDPSGYLQLARLEIANSNPSGAKDDAVKALQIKPDYLDAIAFLSQLQINQGDIPGALSLLQSATAIDGNDAALYYQIGALYYSQKDYANAIDSFEQALRLNTTYAAAEYYLGLSYYQNNRPQDALALFQKMLADDPADKATIETIISNLQAGKAPVSSASTAPITDTSTGTSTSKTSIKKK
jgi:tetratricopeptide (TPR) repeat protein